MPEPSTRERVRELTERGLSVREISSILGISTQAIYKHLRRIEEDDRAVSA